MTQDQCLALPSHFTHLGVCYPGTNASLNLSNPNAPQPVSFTTNGATSVPEPSTAALFAVALVLGALLKRSRRKA